MDNEDLDEYVDMEVRARLGLDEDVEVEDNTEYWEEYTTVADEVIDLARKQLRVSALATPPSRL
jgi:hypothetical protein